jgi:hypothetical protein
VQWVVLEWLEAIKFVQSYNHNSINRLGHKDIARFAHRSHIFYHVIQNQFNTTICDGGLTWNPTLAPYKNAITNELYISSSMAMYLYFTGDKNRDPYPSPTYLNVTGKTLPPLPALKVHDRSLLQNAVKGYEWLRTHNFTNAQGLIVDVRSLSAS